MKVNEIKISKSNSGRKNIPALRFIEEVNQCPDTYAILKEGYYEDTIIIAAVGTLAMEYTMRKVECTFSDYSEREIK